MNPKPENVISFGEQSHIITIAPTRSGKGRDVLIPALLSDQIGAALCIDPKAQLAAVTARHRRSKGRRVRALNSGKLFTDRLGKPVRYNPMTSLNTKSPSFGIDCDSIAQSIIAAMSSDPHWTESARELWSGGIMYFRKYGDSGMQNLGAVRAVIAGPPSIFNAFIADAMATGDLQIIERLSRFADPWDEDREARSIKSTAKTQSAFLGNEAIRESLSGSDFIFPELREGPDTTAFCVLPGEYLQTCFGYNRLILQSAIRELMQARAGKPVTIIVDEFTQLGHMEVLESTMALGAGYGLRLWLIAQDTHLMKAKYPDTWESFLANSGAQQWFRPRDLATAQYLSNRCGQRTVMVKNTSTREISVEEANKGFTGFSHSYSPQGQPLFLPQEIMGMRGDRQLLFLDGVENVIVAGRQPYWTMPELAGRYDPDPYHV